MDIQATCIELEVVGFHLLGLFRPAGMIAHCVMCDLMAFLVHRMSGSWLLSIHPRAQLIFGWLAVNHGYPRMAF